MKILLDECIDRRFGRELPGHEVATVPQLGWAGIKNGKLLSLAQSEFDVFLTVDRSLSSQQDLLNYRIAVVVLQAPSNRLADLQALAPLVLRSLPFCKPGHASLIGGNEQPA